MKLAKVELEQRGAVAVIAGAPEVIAIGAVANAAVGGIDSQAPHVLMTEAHVRRAPYIDRRQFDDKTAHKMG
jgi:hypothetical protein